MAVPKRKTTKSRRNMRRSHHALDRVAVAENKTTGSQALPHHISSDGYYNGRQVIVPYVEKIDETAEETL